MKDRQKDFDNFWNRIKPIKSSEFFCWELIDGESHGKYFK
jgi:hypothetical protein